MLLIEMTIDGTLHYISDEGLALTHWYDPYVVSFSAPQYQTAQEYGGYTSLSFGSIVLSPDLFSGDWPPPKQCSAVIKYTYDTEEVAVTLFGGDLYLTNVDKIGITYDIFAPKYTKKLLAEGPNYDGDTVPYPRAFGTVTHVEPLKVEDIGGKPTYHLAGLGSSSLSVRIIGFSSATAGVATQIRTTSDHGFSNGDSITIYGSVNFSGTHVISSASGSVFTIPVAFPNDDSETVPIHASASAAGDLAIFDDGVPIIENVAINDDGTETFSLSSSPVGTVTMTGTASQTTLLSTVTWGQSQLGIGSIDSTYARASSPEISFWADSQMPIIDFLSDLCAFFTHLFYIKNDILHLVDMLLDNTTGILTEFDFFTASYTRQQVISQIKSTWVTHTAENGFVNETDASRYIKETTNNWIESLYTISSGTADGTVTNKLSDSGANFISDGITVGMVAQNTKDDTSSVVTTVTTIQLTLEDDIFVSGETYIVGPSFPYGQELSIEPYHDNKTNISTALQNILNIMNKDVGEVRVPISENLPIPGQKFTWPDTSLQTDSTMYIRVRTLSYDFLNHEVIISGEGEMS